MSEKKVAKRSAPSGGLNDVKENAPVVPKTPMKRKREDVKEEDATVTRMEWLKERAKNAVVPKEEAAVLKPQHVFYEHGPLIIHVCNDCKKFNAQRQATAVGEGRVQLPLGLCTICRFHFNHQRTIRFFEHELPAIKKTFDL